MPFRRPVFPTDARHHGFTLIEILAVVAIIAILIGILFPAVAHIKEQGRENASKTVVREVKSALEQYYYEYDRWPGQRGTGLSGNQFTDPMAGGVWSNDNNVILAYLLSDHPDNREQKPFLSKREVFKDKWGDALVVQITNNDARVWSPNLLTYKGGQ